MRIQVIAFGKLKTPGMRDAADHYLKLISGFNPISEIELKPIDVPDKSEATRRDVQAREGVRLMEKLAPLQKGRPLICLLDEGGRALPSEGWAREITQAQEAGVQDLIFCVGGSLGFSAEVRSAARLTLSLGPQTLAHGLARVVLLEQIYRALSIVNRHPYHHAGA